MTRFSILSLGLVALVALSGCSSVLTDRYPGSRRSDDRKADRRYDNRAWDRVDRDIRAYTDRLDRELRLDNRQERQIRDLLIDRTRRLARDRRSAYPFPRRLRSVRFSDRSVERFWRDADRRIERVLDRQQTRRYRELTGRGDRRNRNRGRRG